MPHQYAKGTFGLQVCSRCGEVRDYGALVREFVQYRSIQGTLSRTNQLVCKDCADTDTFIKRVKSDPIALRNPRPDTTEPTLNIDPFDFTTALPPPAPEST